jgi:UDP-N-acetylmuramate: L-alanyl-gamma-D-glutamyl-meso-diaminopimelate ligase
MPEVHFIPLNTKHIHIMGVGGTAMAALAGILIDTGYKVTGSDGNVIYPPMSDVLADLGIEAMIGYKASNLDPIPDLVVVGNVIRAVYEEAQALLQSDIPYMSFPALLGAKFIEGKKSIVVAGTHGKTTTSSIAAWLLEAAGANPGFLIGGRVTNFDRTARAGTGDFFAIEGDEYDTAFFDKGPKFLHYRPHTVILTSVEFDHADIYRDLDHCKESFKKLSAIVPPEGTIVARWDQESVIDCVQSTKANIRRYGPGQVWDGRIDGIDTEKGTMHFSVLRHGESYGEFESIMVGEHNLYNQVAIVAALDANGFTSEQMQKGFSSFLGIQRRQELLGSPSDISVIDDFAHHPTAVKVTIEALKLRFGTRRLWAIFEPRSATSRRNIMQEEYARSFDAADIVVIAPPYNQSGIPIEERLDANKLVKSIHARGKEAFLFGESPAQTIEWTPSDSANAIVRAVLAQAMPHDVIAILSNGGFGGIHKKFLSEIPKRFTEKK